MNEKECHASIKFFPRPSIEIRCNAVTTKCTEKNAVQPDVHLGLIEPSDFLLIFSSDAHFQDFDLLKKKLS